MDQPGTRTQPLAGPDISHMDSHRESGLPIAGRDCPVCVDRLRKAGVLGL